MPQDTHSRLRPPLYCLRLPLTSYPLCFTPSPCASAHLETPRMLLKVWETTERALRGYDNVPTSSSHCSTTSLLLKSPGLSSPSPTTSERMSSPPFNPRLKPFLQQEHASHPLESASGLSTLECRAGPAGGAQY